MTSRTAAFILAVTAALSIVSTTYAQVRDAIDSPEARNWLQEKLLDSGRNPYSSENIRKSVEAFPLWRDRKQEIGVTHLESHRFFSRAAHMAQRYDGNTEQAIHWRAKMTDAIVLGTVESVQPEDRICGYGTSVEIRSERVLKGTIDSEIVVVKLLSGRRIGDSVVHTPEPAFTKGERVIVSLTKTPFTRHMELSFNPCTGQSDSWLETDISGNYYELGVLVPTKHTVTGDSVDWFGAKRTVDAVAETLSPLQSR